MSVNECRLTAAKNQATEWSQRCKECRAGLANCTPISKRMGKRGNAALLVAKKPEQQR
jgi:hypothetical protein